MRCSNPVSRLAAAAGICSGVAIVLSTGACAQVGATTNAAMPPVPPPPMTAGFPGGEPPPPPPLSDGTQPNGPIPPTAVAPPSLPAAAQGRLQRFVINPEGDVDGFFLSDGHLVRVPPHLGLALTASFKPGDEVRVAGNLREDGSVRMRQVSGVQSGKQLYDRPPDTDRPRAPPAVRATGLVKLSVQGQVNRVTRTRRGDADGVFLDDGTLVKFPPAIGRQYQSLLQPGTRLAADGYGTRNRYGTALQATALGNPGQLTRLYSDTPTR